MTGPEHYKAAEGFLRAVKTSGGKLMVEEVTAEILLAALTHGVLALAAATALVDGGAGVGVGGGMPQEDYNEWHDVSGLNGAANG